MAWFHSTSLQPAQETVKHGLWRPASTKAIRVLSWLRLWALALGARRAAYAAVEGEISCLKFLEERLDRCLALVDDLAQYPLPAFSFTSRCELVATWRPHQMHAASFLLFGESVLPGESDSFAAEVRAALAAAHMEHERLAERHAAVEDRRQRNLLQRRRQEEAVAATIANHGQAVLQEASAWNATAGTTALLRKQVCAWLLLAFILVTESSFLGLPLLDLVGVNTTSVDAVLARPLLPAAMLLMALMLTHAAIDALAYSIGAILAFRTARTFSGTRKWNLLYPSILITLVIIVLHWIWTIRADYASALGDPAGAYALP